VTGRRPQRNSTQLDKGQVQQRAIWTTAFDGLPLSDCRADLVHMCPVAANQFVELVPADAEFLRPVSNIRTHFGVDLLGIVRPLDSVVFVDGVGLVALGSVVVLRHVVLPLFGSL